MNAVEALTLVTHMNLIRDQVESCNEAMQNPDEYNLNLNGVYPGPIVGHAVNDAMIESLPQLHPERVEQLYATVVYVSLCITLLTQRYLSYQEGNHSREMLNNVQVQMNEGFETYGIVYELIFQVNGHLNDDIELAGDDDAYVAMVVAGNNNAHGGGAIADENNDDDSGVGAG